MAATHMDGLDGYESIIDSTSVSFECQSCDSSFRVDYDPEATSVEIPQYCCFCGEKLEYISVENDTPFEADSDETDFGKDE